MGFVNDAGQAIKNFVLMQNSIERLERLVERQNGDIAGLREVCARLSERLVRVETIIDEVSAAARLRRSLPAE